MNVPIWASELARAFWARARKSEPFPRNLRRSIARAVPLSVVFLPKLSLGAVLDRLKEYGSACECLDGDRPLRACLVARNGHGVAFIDGSNEDAEQTFSIAHELAHFLRDYWSLRLRILKRMGLAARQVLDGERSPTSEEQLHALHRNVPLGFHLHLMERDEDGEPRSWSIAQAEQDADHLAYELLAPVEHVLQADQLDSKNSLEQRLQEFYGLPALQASRYAGILRPIMKNDPLLQRMQSLA